MQLLLSLALLLLAVHAGNWAIGALPKGGTSAFVRLNRLALLGLVHCGRRRHLFGKGLTGYFFLYATSDTGLDACPIALGRHVGLELG